MNNKMKYNRKIQKITLKELAEVTGLSIGYLSHLENGSKTNPSYKTMKKIIDILGENTFDIVI